MERKWHKIDLWELYSKFLSLFYSEFLLKSLHYALFYSFYAYDYHYSPLTSKFLNTLAINKTFSSLYNITISVFVTYFFQITNLPASSTVPEVEMSLFAIFSPIFLSGNSFILTFMLNILLEVSIFCSKFSCIAGYLTVTSYTCVSQLYIHIMDSYSQWRSYTGAHWGTGPTVSLCGPTIKTFSLISRDSGHIVL